MTARPGRRKPFRSSRHSASAAAFLLPNREAVGLTVRGSSWGRAHPSARVGPRLGPDARTFPGEEVRPLGLRLVHGLAPCGTVLNPVQDGRSACQAGPGPDGPQSVAPGHADVLTLVGAGAPGGLAER